MHETLVQLVQTRRPRPDITTIPTHNHTNEQPGHQPRQTPLQY
ncbi:hypothetical protein [Streptomyces sp. NPDC091259]